jgi:hypothetical protein
MWISQGMLWVALAASGLASVGLLSEIISPKVGGVIAALPIVLALIENTMVFNARSDLRWDEARWLAAAYRDLIYGLASIPETIDALKKIEENFARLWVERITNRQHGFWTRVGPATPQPPKPPRGH